MKKTIKLKVDALNEYKHLKKHCLFDLIDNSLKAVDTMSMFVQNV